MKTQALHRAVPAGPESTTERIADMWRGLRRLAAGWGGTPFPSMLSEVRDVVEDAKLRRADYLRQQDAERAHAASRPIAFVEPASEPSRF